MKANLAATLQQVTAQNKTRKDSASRKTKIKKESSTKPSS